MKSIYTIAIIILASSLCYAQTQNNGPVLKGKVMANSLSGADAYDYSVEHSRSAITWLKDHFAKNIEFPEIMIAYGIEGTVVLEVSISEYGKIQQARIVKSPSPIFDNAVWEAMKSIDAIDIRGDKYEGAKKIHIPILFSLK